MNMPSTRHSILISFIGTGPKPREAEPLSQTGYVTANYRMPDNAIDTTSVFGAAMLRWMQRNRLPVKKWLVFGTAGSAWSELLHAMPETKRKPLLDRAKTLALWTAQHQDSRALSDASTIKEAQVRVSQWCFALAQAFGAGVAVIGKVIGSCDSLEGQRDMARAMIEAVEPEAELFIDVSHSFRHLPLIAAFAAPFLRYARNVRDIRFFSGVFELGAIDAEGRKVVPVVELPLCMELLKATEHAATFDNTGSMLPLTASLGLERHDSQALVAVAMADETNQPARRLEAAKAALERTKIRTEPAAPVIAEMLLEKLKSFEGGDVERMLNRARRAIESHQYLKAATLVYEALQRKIVLLHGLKESRKQGGKPDYLSKQVKKLLKRAEDLWKKDPRLVQNVCALNDIFWLRNRLAHASNDKHWRIDAAVSDPTRMRDLLYQSIAFVKRIDSLPGIVPTVLAT